MVGAVAASSYNWPYEVEGTHLNLFHSEMATHLDRLCPEGEVPTSHKRGYVVSIGNFGRGIFLAFPSLDAEASGGVKKGVISTAGAAELAHANQRLYFIVRR